MGISLSSNADRILRKLERAPKHIQEGVVRGCAMGLIELETEVRTKTWIKPRRGAAGLMGRLTSYAQLRFGQLDAAIGFRRTTGFPYELAQEFGAQAKKGRAMSIPVTAAARRAGSPRDFPQQLIRLPGTRVLVAKTGKRTERLVTHYVLTTAIKPRLRFRANVTAGIPHLSLRIEQGAKQKLKDL